MHVEKSRPLCPAIRLPMVAVSESLGGLAVGHPLGNKRERTLHSLTARQSSDRRGTDFLILHRLSFDSLNAEQRLTAARLPGEGSGTGWSSGVAPGCQVSADHVACIDPCAQLCASGCGT